MSQEVKDNFLHSFFSDEDLFPGCKFDEHLNLISIVDPFPFETSLLTSSLDEPKQSSEVEPVVDGRSSSFSESFTQSVYLDEEKETNSFNWSTHATASSHASQSFERFLSDVSINEKSLSQVSSVASFSSMGFFPYADLSKVKQTATYIQPRPSLSQSHPIHSYSILKSMSKAPGRSNAISRWRVEKRALYLKTRQSQEKRETALKNLMETAETIVLGIQAQQALKKKHRPTPALSRPSEKIKDQVPGLQAIKKFYEKKRNRIQERMKWVERKRILREKNSIAIQVKLQNEFQSIPKSSCSSPLLSSLPKEGDQQKKDAHTTIIRLPSIGAQEFEKTKKILAHSRKSLSKLPNEFQPLLKSSCTDEKSMLKKSFPLPIIHPKQLSTSLSGPLTIPTKVPNNDPLRPHPHLHASPSSLTFSRSQPCLQIKFTNTLDSVLRVSLLPMELDLEDRFTFTSTPTLSLAKGISLSTQVHLKVHDNEVLKDTKVLGLRVLVNGELCVWPLMIEGDRMSLACRPSTQIDFEFTNPSQQVLQLKNTGTLMGDVEVHSTTSMVSWSPSQFSLAPAQSQRFIVQFTPPNNEEKPSLQTSKSSNHWSSLTNHYALLLEKLTFSYPKQNCQPLLEIPIRIHLPLVPFIVEPKHTQFFYCPTTLQVKTTFTLVNQLRHSLRFTIKTQCIPSVNDIQVLVKPEQSLLQVGSPLSIQVQLKCEEPIKMPTCMQVACHLTIQTKEEEKKKSFSQTCVLQGTFFNPDFQLSVHHLQWSSMGIMETYSSPLTIRNPTPVFMTLGMSCTCPMATVRFTPMTSKDTLVLAPNQTVVGTLHVTPFQSGPLRGQIEWKNLFGVIKAIVLHSEVFQPFATFDTMQYTFPEVCEGHVSRHILHLSWYLNEREQRGVVKYPEERGTFQVCKPEWVRVLNDPTAGPPVEKNCSDLSPHELSALRIYPTQGVIQWGQRCALHVAYAPVPSRVSGRKAMPMDLGSSSMGLTLDPKSVPLPSYPHSPTNDQPNAPVNGSESIDLTINTNLTSGGRHSNLSSHASNSTSTKSPSRTTSPNRSPPLPVVPPSSSIIVTPSSMLTTTPSLTSSFSSTTSTSPPSGSSSSDRSTHVTYYRVPVIFTFNHRSRDYGPDDRPTHHVQFLEFRCPQVPIPFQVSTNKLTFAPIPVDGPSHSIQTIQIINLQNKPLSLTWTSDPQGPFVLISKTRTVQKAPSILEWKVGFFPTRLGSMESTCWIATDTYRWRLKCEGIGVEGQLIFEQDGVDPSERFVLTLDPALLNEPSTMSRTLQSTCKYPLPIHLRLNPRGTTSTRASSNDDPVIECSCPSPIPAQATVSMTWTCAAQSPGWYVRQGSFQVNGLGYREFEVRVRVHQYTAYCQGPIGSEWELLNHEGMEWILWLPKSTSTVTLVHQKPSNASTITTTSTSTSTSTKTTSGTKPASKKSSRPTSSSLTSSSVVAQFHCKELLQEVHGGSFSLEVGKSVSLSFPPSILSLKKVSFIMSGAMDLFSKKIVTPDAPVVYHVCWLDH